MTCLMQNFDTHESVAMAIVLAANDDFVEQFVPEGPARSIYRCLRSQDVPKELALLEVLRVVVANHL